MRRHITVLFLALALVASACSGDDGAGPDEPDDTTPGTGVDPARGDRTAGPLGVSLSEGQGTPIAAEAVTVVEGSPLDAQAVAQVVERLPDWVSVDGDQVDFNRPAESLRPPVAGNTIDAAFPAEDDQPPPDVETGALEVLRQQPEGAVGLAPFVSLTFNQPMVALGTVAQTDAADVPVTITPELPGRWQWIGTRTLRFEHDPEVFDRLPMATSYVVEVPAGTKSATGSTLAADHRVEFVTPPPSLVWLTPGGQSLPLEPVFVASFDQRVDPAAILAVTSVAADGQAVEIRLATDAEIAADEDAANRVKDETEGTWVAFRANDALPADAAITVEIGPRIPSAEGPDTNDTVASREMRTYAPLRVRQQSCTGADPCEPEWGFWVDFNNPLDSESVEADDLVVSPEIPGAYIRIQGSSISVEGELTGSTTYEMTVPAGLTDVFGQTLGDDTTLAFEIDAATPSLDWQDDTLVTLDPLVDTQTLPLQLRNHDQIRVRAFAVEPVDWRDFQEYADRRYELDLLPAPAWPEIYDDVVDTGAPADERFEARIDLEPVFAGEPGMAVVIVEPVGALANLSRDDELWWQNRPVVQWVQATSIGADLLSDHDEGVVWTTDLRTGVPLEGVAVQLVGDEETHTTDADGLVRFALPAQETDTGPLIATLGDDVAITRASAHAWSPGTQTIWYVADDRAMYRPGETMRVKGWVRMLDLERDATLAMLPTGELFTYVVRDGFGNDLANGEVRLSETGAFDFAADIPLGANLGAAWIEFQRPATPGEFGYSHQFEIQEFRRPEFEVTTRAETQEPYLIDDPATIAADAAYYSGGPLPDAPVDWTVVTRTGSYAPPGWDDFTFGTWTPWWSYSDLGFGPQPGVETSTETFSGTTDATGAHYLQMAFTGDGDGQPTTVSATATVTDVNRQAWSSTTDLLVHAADLYTGLRATRTFVRAGDPLDVEVVVTDIDGAAVSGRAVTVTADRVREDFVDGEWTEVVLDSESCDLTSGDDPETCTFAMENGGEYRITSRVVDDAGRESVSEMTRWVTGGDAGPSRRLELQQATIVPDEDEYAAGDTAELFVSSPFGPAHGLMTISRNGFVAVETFEITDSDTVVEVDILDEYVPSLHVDIELVGVSERAADDGTVLPDVAPRPAFASGAIDLRVPPASRTLSVEVVPADDVVEPGSDTSVAVDVTDASGSPVVDAELLVVAVDEAVLVLSGFELLDPVEVFYRSLGANIGIQRGRDSIRLADPEALMEYAARLHQEIDRSLDALSPDDAVGGGDFTEEAADTDATASPTTTVGAYARSASSEGADLNESGTPIEVRTNFDALAVWAPDVTTDAAGRATVDIDVPDSLTRYRVMVVAVDGVDRFGSAESAITARLPLQVRPAAPRFLNYGDDFDLPIVVQNLTDADLDVDVVVETANLLVDGSNGRSVTVPANDRIEVRFPVTTESAGTARFRASAVSTDHADASTVALPVYTPSTAEAFATYGVVDDGAIVQPFLAPADVLPQFGGLEVTTSSTAVQALTDAVIYLEEYEYTNADGYASRILAIAALRDVLEAFDAEGIPTPAEFDAIVADDISALRGLQNGDGGFPTWRRGDPVSPYRTVHVMHALFEAEANGYGVPAEMLRNGSGFLQNIESYIPQDWSESARDTLVAYSLFVRRVGGDVDAAKARAVFARQGIDFGLDAIAWLWPVVDDAGIEAQIARNFQNRATETAQAATFTTDYGDDGALLLHSDRRTDGVVLDALIAMDPGSDLIPKVVAGLIGKQRQGRWNNAQENAFILVALNNYFDTFETIDPDFVARVWLGDLYAAEHTFAGRSIDSAQTVVPMDELIEIGDDDLVLSKEGAGRLYYRLGLRYAPADFALDPLDRGFVVQRSYEAIDDDGDVTRDSDGVWHVKAGAQVRVNLTMVNDSRRTNMALIDPLPAGFEALNPALAVTPPIPEEPIDEEFGFEGDTAAEFAIDVYPGRFGGSWWWGPWYDHQNLRDDRTEAFAAWLEAGTHEYSYVARATTPGTFVVPPSRAEEIYAPEVFGRSGSDILIVAD